VTPFSSAIIVANTAQRTMRVQRSSPSAVTTASGSLLMTSGSTTCSLGLGKFVTRPAMIATEPVKASQRPA